MRDSRLDQRRLSLPRRLQSPMSRSLPSIAALAVLVGLLVVGCGGGGETASTYVPTSPDPGATAVDTANLAPGFAVFRGPREDRDRLRRHFPYGLIASMGLDLDASRYSRQVYGEAAHLIPAKGLVCLLTANEAVGSCWKPAVIKAGKAVATTLCGPGLGAGQVVTFGLVPDGIEEVTIVRTNVPSVTVPVEGNVFVGKTSSTPPLPLRVAWDQGGERVVRSSGIPPKVAREGC